MPLLTIVLALIAVGVLLWLVEKYLPLDATIKRIIHILVIVVVVVWLMKVFGLWAYLSQIHV